jgi:hypothetical protein
MWRSNHNARQYTVFPVGWPVLLAIGRAQEKAVHFIKERAAKI